MSHVPPTAKSLPKEFQEAVEKLGVAIIFQDPHYKASEKKIEIASESLVKGGWCDSAPTEHLRVGNFLVFLFNGSENFDNVKFGRFTRDPRVNMIMSQAGCQVRLWPAVLMEMGHSLKE